MKQIIAALVVAGALALPSESSAWLICDPCCKSKKSEPEEGRRLAIAYAQAGQNLFGALHAMEERNIGDAQSRMRGFFQQVDKLSSMMSNTAMSEPLSAILLSREGTIGVLSQKLPDLEQLADLGTKWATAQIAANEAVLAKCRQ